MALFINTNTRALNAQRQLAQATRATETSVKRLASGLRINNARDDAAGLHISNRLSSQINGLTQGNRNAQDGISLCQVAEGALGEMTDMYQRIRTLAVQSANGTNSDAERQAIQQEVSELCSEINRLGEDTTFGGIHIFNKSLTEPTLFQVGAYANETISVDLSSGFRINDILSHLSNNPDPEIYEQLMSGGLTSKVSYNSGNPPAFYASVDPFAPPGEYMVEVVHRLSYTYVYKPYSKLDLTVDDGNGNLVTIPFNERTFGSGTITFTGRKYSEEKSFTINVEEGDTWEDILNKTHGVKNFYLLILGTSVYEEGSNDPIPSLGIQNVCYGEENRPLSITTSGDEALKIFEFNVSAEGSIEGDDWKIDSIGHDAEVLIDGDRFTNDESLVVDQNRGVAITTVRSTSPNSYHITVTGAVEFSVDTTDTAQSTIAIVDQYIKVIDNKRAELGAVQNRLNSAINNQENIAENLSDARSRIRDIDYAAETANLARQNILQETSSTILTHANHSGDIILSLLQN